MALGASPFTVVGTIARRAAFQLTAGVVVGVVFGAWLLEWSVVGDSNIVDVSVPVVLAGVSLAVVLIVVASCAPPILRGLRIEPTKALREG